jgi:chloramphenicol-sensitive protein RarD
VTDASTAEEALVLRRGLLYGFAAYASWGFMPVYIKAVRAAPVLEVLSHRIVWAFLLLLVIVWRRGELPVLAAALRSGRTLAVLTASTTAIAINWLVYIWAVQNGHVLDSSLGYFINPLVNVLFGVLLLHERLDRTLRVAFAIAGLGVLWLAIRGGHVPWIALTLATSFGSYGLLRKLAPVGALVGLTIETALLTPLAGGYLVWSGVNGRAAIFSGSASLDALLLLAGPVTAIPLLFFAGAARRLPLSTLGFLQYVSPTLQFLLAVLAYREPLDGPRLVAFALIWTALAIFAVHTGRTSRRAAARAREVSA